MKKTTFRKLSSEQEAMLRELDALPEDQIDTSDIPEITDWSGAQRGLFYRPVKQQITLRLDADVIAWFKEQSENENGRGYQTRINQVLREYVVQHAMRR
ncbi:MAG: BrnA antitoxin family protein [Caldilineaceae bacterium]